MKFIISVWFLVFGTLMAHAGDGSTSVKDGGHGILCKTFARGFHVAGTIYDLDIEFLDFYEGRSLDDSIDASGDELIGEFYLQSPSRGENLCWDLSRRQKQLNLVIGPNIISQAFRDACRLSHSMEFRDSVPKTNDHGTPLKKLRRKCELVQIGYRTVIDGVESISIDKEFAIGMTYKELAGLALHESLHKYFPLKKSTKSIRQIVFYSFANRDFQLRNRELILKVIHSGQEAAADEFR